MTKKVCLSVCGGLLMLASCSNDEFQPAKSAETSRDVGFNVVTGKPTGTRATTITTSTIADFMVYGYKTGDAAFLTHLNGVTAAKANTPPWSYGSDWAAWPDEEVTFIAYAPAASVVKSQPTAGATISNMTYVVPDKMDEQFDFLVAKTAQTYGAGNNTVTMNFKHALSKLLFQARLVTGQKVKILDISLMNLLMEGTMDLTTAATTPVWSPVQGSELKDAQSNEALWPVHTWTTGNEPEISTNTYVDVIDDDHAVMVLPQPTNLGQSFYNADAQKVADMLATNQFYIAVTWDLGGGISRTALCAVGNGLSLTTPITFEPGKQYTFRLDLDAESDLITVGNVKVDDMQTGTGDVMDRNIAAVVIANNDTVAWAKNDVGVPNQFVADGAVGYFYQMNGLVGWKLPVPLSGYQADGTKVTYTYPTSNSASAWTAANNPCPAGWRLPTRAEFSSMNTAATGRSAGSGLVKLTIAGNELSFVIQGWINGSGASANTTTCYYWASDSAGSGTLPTFNTTTGAYSSGNVGNTAEGYTVRCVKSLKKVQP